MERGVLGFAASLAAMMVPAAAAQAQSWPASAFTSGSAFESDSTGGGVVVHRGHSGMIVNGPDRRDGRHRRDHRDRGGIVGDWPYADGQWALYNNRSWEPDSYNDWWHDRPDRAFPRWMQNNQDCARSYYVGDVLSC